MNISLDDIPEYLKRSDLYMNIVQENLDQMHLELENEIPQEENCDTFDKYVILFKTYNFWCCSPGKSFIEYQERNKVKVLKFLISVIDKYDFAKLLINDIYQPINLDINYQILDTKRMVTIGEIESEIDTKLYIVNLNIKDMSMSNKIQFKFYSLFNVKYFTSFLLLLLTDNFNDVHYLKMGIESFEIKTFRNDTNKIFNINGYIFKFI